MTKFTVVKETNEPYDHDRPYYIAGSDYDEFNQLEAATVAAILNEAGEVLDWDTITADYRWLMVEAIQAEITRLQDELKVTDQLLDEHNRLLAAIPECPHHGQCIPHAIDWVRQSQAEITRLQAALVAIQEEIEEEL